MKLFFYCILLLIAVPTQAQIPVIEWQKSLGGSGEDRAYSVAQTKDGGYIASGMSESVNGDVKGNHGKSMDYWVVKLNAGGMLEWQRSLGSSSIDWGSQVIVTSDSGFLISGFTMLNDGDVTVTYGEIDCWLVKLNNKGVIQWEKSFGGTNNDGNSYEGPAFSIVQTTDGGYIMATTTWSADGQIDSNHGMADYWIVKLNDTGKIEWQRTYGGSDYDVAHAVKQTEDGGFIVMGQSSSSNGDITAPLGLNDYWVLKLDHSGAIEWQKNFGGTQDDIGNDILSTPDGYILAGYSSSGDGYVTGHHYSSDYWIAKIDKSGRLLWQKSLGGTGGEFANSICQSLDGSYVVAGYSYSFDGDALGGHREADYWIVNISDAGKLKWQYKIGGYNEDLCYQVKTTSDNGYILVGYSGSNDGEVSHHRGANDYWLVKLGYPKLSQLSEPSNLSVKLYPNPASDFLIAEGLPVGSGFTISDIYGRTVYRGEITEATTQIPVGSFFTGMYIFSSEKGYKTLITIIR